jgi:hypothetical protein
VQSAAGFRGIEVLRDCADPAIFYLITKWERIGCYDSWYKSPAHDASHNRIPKGLQLDPTYTRVEVLHDEPSCQSVTMDAFFYQFASNSTQLISLQLDSDGVIQTSSGSFDTTLKFPSGHAIGKPIGDFLVEGEAQALAIRLTQGNGFHDCMLNFVDRDGFPISVRASLLVQDHLTRLIAERDSNADEIVQRQSLELHNEWARLTREIQQTNRQLATAHDELSRAIDERDKSYWFIRKVHEVLPYCMGCKKVMNSPSAWEGLEEYLKKNTDFLSHTYCPQCLEGWRAHNL